MPPSRSAPTSPLSLDALRPGTPELGFLPAARYVDGDGRPRGARFVHTRTGFVFDYLAIESAPQAFLYAVTYPTSDRGEPHTQEHLLLGRGNKGRLLGNTEHTSLARSSAFTAQYRTAYHFHTSAGEKAFWGVLHQEIDSLLHPDYTDEEIRREVRNFEVVKGPTGALSLEEKGTVYNEMVRSYEEADRLSWLAMDRMVFGPGHPLAFSAGGTPEAIRELLPEDIRRFHAAHYRLGNMGMVAAFPAAIPLTSVLSNVGETLDAFASPAAGTRASFLREEDLPVPRGAAPGALELVSYPYATEDHPGAYLLGWPATRHLAPDERMVMELFLGALAGGEGSLLYGALVDQKTRTLDTGATRVYPEVRREPGQAAYVTVDNVRAASADLATLGKARDLVLREIARVAAFPDGSSELKAFGERVRARVTEARRALDKMLDTPPEFGTRGTYSEWIDLLTDVQADPGFDKSLVRSRAFRLAEETAAESQNPWRERVRAWGLDQAPYGVVSHPSPALRKSLDEGRAARVAAERARLLAAEGTTDPVVALTRRRVEIDEADRALAAAEARVPMPPLTRDPPMTEDDLLAFRIESIGKVPMVAATVSTMKSVTAGVALRLDAVPEALLPYLSVLPSLLRDAGVVKNGVPLPYDEVRDRLRKEVLGASVYLSASPSSGRAELVLEGSGNDVEEARRALGWLGDFLFRADLRPENLARLKDVVTRQVVDLGNVMTAPEEHWVERVEEAYWRQRSPLLTHATSFLTRAHDAQRILWQLEGGSKELGAFLDVLGGAGKGRTRRDLGALADALANLDDPPKHDPRTPVESAAHALPSADRARVKKLGRDLGRLLGDLTDAHLAEDWRALCREAAIEGGSRAPRADAARRALSALGDVLAAVRRTDNARAWVVGSEAGQEALRPAMTALLAELDPAPITRASYGSSPLVLDRARARGGEIVDPTWVALVNPSTANGAITASAKLPAYEDASEAATDLYLGANVPSGTGAHGLYKRIWGAGLAYSGYVWASPRYGRYKLYSDRCADLVSLLSFVDAETRRMPEGEAMVEYAAARAFTSRVADTYETRARALAVDLVEGFPPDKVRAFRERILEARERPGVAGAVHARIAPAYAKLLPSGASSAAADDEVIRMIVGPEKQIAAVEEVLEAGRRRARIGRLFPRDFWVMAAGAEGP